MNMLAAILNFYLRLIELLLKAFIQVAIAIVSALFSAGAALTEAYWMRQKRRNAGGEKPQWHIVYGTRHKTKERRSKCRNR